MRHVHFFSYCYVICIWLNLSLSLCFYFRVMHTECPTLTALKHTQITVVSVPLQFFPQAWQINQPQSISLPVAQLKFFIIIKTEEIYRNRGHFTKKHIPYVVIDRTIEQEMNVILNFTEFALVCPLLQWH